jgi:hypothetical protein
MYFKCTNSHLIFIISCGIQDVVDISSHGVLDPNLNEKLSEENLALFTR